MPGDSEDKFVLRQIVVPALNEYRETIKANAELLTSLAQEVAVMKATIDSRQKFVEGLKSSPAKDMDAFRAELLALKTNKVWTPENVRILLYCVTAVATAVAGYFGVTG